MLYLPILQWNLSLEDIPKGGNKISKSQNKTQTHNFSRFLVILAEYDKIGKASNPLLKDVTEI